MNEPTKILFAEDSRDHIKQWSIKLKEMDFKEVDPMDEGAFPNNVLRATAPIILRHPKLNAEVHFVAHNEILDKAVTDHKYVLCFVDAMLLGDGHTSIVVLNLTKKENMPHIVLISSSVQLQATALERGGIPVNELIKNGKMSLSVKDFDKNKAKIMAVLNLAPMVVPKRTLNPYNILEKKM